MSENQRETFVKNLKRYMKQRGVDQSDIVAALGVPTSTVSDWVTGKSYPRVGAMQRLADFLNVYYCDLTIDEGSESDLPPLIDPGEMELVKIWQGLNARGQDALLRQARYLNDDPDMKKSGESSDVTTA